MAPAVGKQGCNLPFGSRTSTNRMASHSIAKPSPLTELAAAASRQTGSFTRERQRRDAPER